MDKSLNRIHFLDIMRGFAVVVMVMGHSIDSVLSPEARATEAFRWYDMFRGFTAPMFLFVAGYAFMVATARRWEDYRAFGKPVLKRLSRVALLFVIGYALHFPFFSLTKILTNASSSDLAQLFQVDILHCVAAGLLILHIVLLLTPSLRAFAHTMTVLAAGIALASPFIWSIDFAPLVSPALSPYFNQTQLSMFPVFPYAAYLFSGVVVGYYFLEARRTEQETVFIKRILALAICAIVLAFVFDRAPVSLYPEYDFWKTSPNLFVIRIGIVMLITLAFYYIRRLPEPLERSLVRLGQASLMVYALHLVIVYGSSMNKGLYQLIGQTLQAHYAVATGVFVLGLMIAVVFGWNYLRSRHFIPTRIIQVGLVSSLLYIFVSRPW